MTDFDAFRFGKGCCKHCGHHSVMHLSAREILMGIPSPCEGAKEGDPPCQCMRYVASEDDEPMFVFMKDGKDVPAD